uniref:[RNA-polymerase]-subunit kinase n=1 Tax=Zea mays TaxID=4577 RepID=B4FYS9_MAIZE|nr:unknown [Zea mays]
MSHLLERETDIAVLPHSDQRDGVEARLILRGCTPASFTVASIGPNNEISGAVPPDALAKAAPALFASRAPRPSLKYLELLLPAEIGSDHIELPTAATARHIVAQVTGSNMVSVAEGQLRCALVITHNFLSGHHQAVSKEWDVVAFAHPVCNLEEKTVDTICTGQIEHLLQQYLKPSPTLIGAKVVLDEMQQSNWRSPGRFLDVNICLIKCYMQQLFVGLQHCHERGILHQDIKGSNLLIDYPDIPPCNNGVGSTMQDLAHAIGNTEVRPIPWPSFSFSPIGLASLLALESIAVVGGRCVLQKSAKLRLSIG